MKLNHSTSAVERKLYRFAFSRVCVLVLLALLGAAVLIALVNDLYAFVKPDHAVELQIREPITLNEWARLLEKNGVIQNPTAFQVYVRSKKKASLLEGFCGSLSLNASMSYREILLAMTESDTRTRREQGDPSVSTAP